MLALAGARGVKAFVLDALGAGMATRARRRSRDRGGGIPAPHHINGRTLQPPRHARTHGRRQLRARPRRQYAGCGIRAAAVRGDAGARGRREVRGAVRRRRLSCVVVAARVVGTGAVDHDRRDPRAGVVGAFACDRRRARRRPARQLRGRNDGGGERGGRRGRRGQPAHRQPAAGRQQRDLARRRAAGVVADPAASVAAARALPRPRHRRHRVGGGGRFATAGGRGGIAPGSHRRVGAFHRRCAQTRACT